MINAIYGKKIGMTQIFGEDDRVVPVTVIQAEPNKVCQVKTKATDGYEAVQLGFGAIKEKKVNKPMAGHFAKQGTQPVRYLREVRVDEDQNLILVKGAVPGGKNEMCIRDRCRRAWGRCPPRAAGS